MQIHNHKDMLLVFPMKKVLGGWSWKVELQIFVERNIDKNKIKKGMIWHWDAVKIKNLTFMNPGLCMTCVDLLCSVKQKTHWHLSYTVISSWMHVKLGVNVCTLCLKQSVNDSSLVNDMLVCLKPSVTNWVIPIMLGHKNSGKYWLGEG